MCRLICMLWEHTWFWSSHDQVHYFLKVINITLRDYKDFNLKFHYYVIGSPDSAMEQKILLFQFSSSQSTESLDLSRYPNFLNSEILHMCHLTTEVLEAQVRWHFFYIIEFSSLHSLKFWLSVGSKKFSILSSEWTSLHSSWSFEICSSFFSFLSLYRTYLNVFNIFIFSRNMKRR